MNEAAYEDVFKKITNLQQSISHLYSETDSGQQAIQLCQKALEDCEYTKERLRFSKPIIAVVGEKNSGKSAFCQSLLKNNQKKESIKSGYGSQNATTKVQWFGSERPKKLDAELEEWNHVDSSDFKNPESEFVLVDVPGFNDISSEAQVAAKSIMKYVSVIVVMANWDSGLELESVGQYLNLAHGAYVVPIISDAQYGSRPNKEQKEEIQAYKNRLMRLLGKDKISEPVYVPRWTALPVDKQLKAKAEAEKNSEMALNLAIKNHPVTNQIAYYRCYEQLRANLESLLQEELSSLSNAYRDLKVSEKNMIVQLTRSITGTDTQLQKGLRLRILVTIAESCSGKYFPFKSFLSLLAITSGAWDRLTMSLAGSLPSLAMVIFQSGKNVNSLTSQKEEARHGLSELLDSSLKCKLEEENSKFYSIVSRQSSYLHLESEIEKTTMIRDSDISNIEITVDQIINGKIKSNLGRMHIMNTIAKVAVVVWLFLAAGPVLAVYGSYIAANVQSIFSMGSSLSEFTSLTFSTLLFSLIVIFLPVFILAMIALSSTATDKMILTIATEVSKDIEKHLVQMIESAINSSENEVLALRRNASLLIDELSTRQKVEREII